MPSWDMALGILFLIGIAFGYILQKEKITATLLSVYVSLVITQAIWGDISMFLNGEKTINKFWIDADASPFTIKTAVFVGIIVLLSAKAGIGGSKSKGLLSPLEIVAYSVMTVALVMSTIFHFMPAEMMAAFAGSSKIAAFIINNYLLVILAPAGTMIAMGFFKGSD